MGAVMVDNDDDEMLCGEAFDHDEAVTYDGPDGYQWYCRRCGAEGWEEPASPGTATTEEVPTDGR